MKRISALILAWFLVVVLLAGCGGSPTEKTSISDSPADTTEQFTDSSTYQADDLIEVDKSQPMEMTIGIISDVGSFYPGGSGNSGVKTKRVMLYETLFWKDANDIYYPLLAKNYTDKGNGTYEFELFDYIYDTAGNHLTASDVIFSIEGYIIDGQNASTWATISDYHTTGEFTFEITFEPEVICQLNDFMTRVPIITEAAWNASPDEMAFDPVGTSGYILNTEESILGSVYVFDRHDHYWQTDEQYICSRNQNNLSRLTAKVIPDPFTLAIALEQGDIDFATDIEANDRGLFVNTATGEALPGYIILQGQNNSFVHMTFNCGSGSPCQDIKLRQAICYAIDAAACKYTIYGTFGGVCNAATNPNLSDSGMEFGHDGYFDYDPAFAKQLVEESSYDGETITILVISNNTVRPIVPLIKEYCAEIGVNVDSLEYDNATYRKLRVETTGELYDIELLGTTSADDAVYVSVKELDNRSYDNGLNRLFIEDAELQELYEKAGDARTTSPDVIQQLLDHIEENCYIYGLYYCPKMCFGTDRIKAATVIPFDDAIYPSFVVQ